MSGDDHVACDTCSGRPRTPTASGDTRAGSESPGVAPVQVRHSVCASQKPLTLLRGVDLPRDARRWHSRTSGRSTLAGSTSGAYSHCVGSPAFRL